MLREVPSRDHRGTPIVRRVRVVFVRLRVRRVARHLPELAHLEVFPRHRSHADTCPAPVSRVRARPGLRPALSAVRRQPPKRSSPLASEGGERTVGRAVIARGLVEGHIAFEAGEAAHLRRGGEVGCFVERRRRRGAELVADRLVPQIAHQRSEVALRLVRLELAEGDGARACRLVELVLAHVPRDGVQAAEGRLEREDWTLMTCKHRMG